MKKLINILSIAFLLFLTSATYFSLCKTMSFGKNHYKIDRKIFILKSNRVFFNIDNNNQNKKKTIITERYKRIIE